MRQPSTVSCRLCIKSFIAWLAATWRLNRRAIRFRPLLSCTRYVRLVDANSIDWHDRAHFYAICARLMRRILIDFARSRNYQKRGAGFAHIQLEEAVTVTSTVGSELLAVDEALKRLTLIDARKSEVVEMRFFGGMTAEEISAALKVSPQTVTRDWKLAKAWLQRELSREGSADGS